MREGFDGWLNNYKGNEEQIPALLLEVPASFFPPLLPGAHRGGFIVVEQMAKFKHDKQLIPLAGEG